MTRGQLPQRAGSLGLNGSGAAGNVGRHDSYNNKSLISLSLSSFTNNQQLKDGPSTQCHSLLSVTTYRYSQAFSS